MNTTEPKKESQEPVQHEFHANPGVPVPEESSTTFSSPEGDGQNEISTKIAMPDTPDTPTGSVEDMLDAAPMNPIEERASSQNKKYMVVLAVVAIVIIALVLMYMWGSRIAEDNGAEEVVATTTDTQADVPALPEATAVPVEGTELSATGTVQDAMDLPELDSIDADMEAFEEELDALLEEDMVL